MYQIKIRALIVVILLSMPCALLAQRFIFGVDLSYVNQMQDCGASYRVNGKITDPFKIFHDYGANMVRVRLWNNPDWTKYSNFNDVVKTLRRSKQRNMQTMLDFHYSDDWADPENQVIPKKWRHHFGDDNKLAQDIYQYTFNTLLKLNKLNLMPNVVQIGNEINQGLLHKQKLKSGEHITVNWKRTAKLLNAGLKAVKDIEKYSHKKISTMIHIAQPENALPWFSSVVNAGLNKFDMIGLSYYPRWSTHSFAQVTKTIKMLHYRFDKKIFLVETAYPWTLASGDEASNLMSKDSLYKGYSPTIRGQKKYMIDLTQATIAGGGSGIAYWEPAWVVNKCKTRWGVGSHWENMTFFDFRKNNEIHQGISFLSNKYQFPVNVTFKIKANKQKNLFLWASFFESDDFVVQLKKAKNGYYFYKTKLMPKEEIYYQIYNNTSLDNGLLTTKNNKHPGFVTTIINRTSNNIIYNLY